MNALLDRLVSRFPQNQRGAFRCSPLVEPPANAPDSLVRRFFALFPDNQRGAFRCFPFFDGLPNEVFVHILRFLDLESKATCRLVCGEWNQAILELSLLRFAKLKLKMTFSFLLLRWDILVENGSNRETTSTWSDFPPLYNVDTLVFDNIIGIERPIWALQMPQMRNLTRCRIVFNYHLRKEKPSEFWAHCVKIPTLREVICDYPRMYDYDESPLLASTFFTEHSRDPLPKLQNLTLNGFLTTVDELVFLFENVADIVDSLIPCSVEQFVQVLTKIVANPAELTFSTVTVSDLERLGELLCFPQFPNVAVTELKNERPTYRITIDAFWEVNIYIISTVSVFCHEVGGPDLYDGFLDF